MKEKAVYIAVAVIVAFSLVVGISIFSAVKGGDREASAKASQTARADIPQIERVETAASADKADSGQVFERVSARVVAPEGQAQTIDYSRLPEGFLSEETPFKKAQSVRRQRMMEIAASKGKLDEFIAKELEREKVRAENEARHEREKELEPLAMEKQKRVRELTKYIRHQARTQEEIDSAMLEMQEIEAELRAIRDEQESGINGN